MVYLQNITESQPLAIPRPCRIPLGDLTLQARSTVDLNVVMDVEVLDLRLSEQYIFLAVSLPEGCPNGEYQYILSAGGKAFTTGLMILCQEGEGFSIIGDGEFSREEYNKKTTYEQYESTE